MGMIKVSVSAIQGTATDQWKATFIAGEMSGDELPVRAKQIAESELEIP